MFRYISDFVLVSILVVGFTAIMGVLSNGIGNHIFGGHSSSEFIDQSNKSSAGFKLVGGIKKRPRKHWYTL
ncbi:MAG: hypothetical protein K0R18_1121 [Bacillales bacterium]|jgi:hypothetical protein|nr:hypothetical protein [Bacillales bacterium]